MTSNKIATNDSSCELQTNATRVALDVFLAIIIPTIFRLLWINTFNLCEDEAYYWEWSRRLALSYHDAGPGIALAIRTGTSLFGNTVFGIRFMAVILFSCALGFIYKLVCYLYDRRTALWTVLFLNIIPLFALGGLLMIYDTVQAFFWCAALYCFARAVRLGEKHVVSVEGNSKPGPIYWWALTGLCVGLGFDGKYTAVLFIPAAIAYLLVHKRERRWFTLPHPYFMGFIALLAVSPVLYWNFQHDWRSVVQILSLGKKAKYFIQPQYFFELLGGQLGIISPILFAFMGWRLIDAWKKGVLGQDRRKLFMLIFCLLYSGPFFLLACKKRVFANWPGIGYVTGIILVATWYVSVKDSWEFKISSLRKWFLGGVWLAIAFTVILYLHLATCMLPFRPKKDPLTPRFVGWPEMVQHAEQLRGKHQTDGHKVYFYAATHQLAALVAFYASGQPMDVREVKCEGRPNQYDLWGDLRPGEDAILLVPGKNSAPDIVYKTFDKVDEEKPLSINLRGKTAKLIRFYYCRNYHPVSSCQKSAIGRLKHNGKV